MTAGELHDELAQRGARLATVALAALERGSLQFTPQSNDGVTYANKIEKSETRIDWAKPWSKCTITFAASRLFQEPGSRPPTLAASKFCGAPRAKVPAGPGKSWTIA